MKLSLRHKLFLVLLTSTVVVVGATYGFMRWSFDQGFIRFVEERRRAQMEQLVGRLAAIHVAEGGWQTLGGDRKRWGQLQKETRGPTPEPRQEPGAGDGKRHAPQEKEAEKEANRKKPPKAGKFSLLDADRTIIFGREEERGRLRLTPITAAGRVVGYVGAPAAQPLSEMRDIGFAERQGRDFALIALGLGLLAALAGWPLAETLLRPLRRITAGARALASGRFETRVAVAGGDELAELAEDFNALAQTLQQTEAARRQWIADISHELRTPVALLKAELEALQDGVRPLNGAAVDSLAGEAERLNRLVDDLYQLSLSDLGALSYRKQPLDACARLREAVAALRGEFADKGIAVRLLGADAVCGLTADADRLAQLFANLLRNALRYTDAGGQLDIQVRQESDGLVFDFQDSPPGVPAEARERLFERFFRVEASRNRALGGAGLGLAICRNIVEAHGGSISAHDSPLGGLRIRVRLPVAS